MARHETEDYASELFVNANNAFGFKVPPRPSYRNGTYKIGQNVYSSYASLDSSIADIIRYFDFVNFPTQVKDVEHFVRELRVRNYFTDRVSNYTRGVKYFLEKYN